MDWMTLAIEVIGAVIFCVWVVIPIREYRSIYQRLRHRADAPAADDSARSGRNSNAPPTPDDNDEQEAGA